MSLADIGSAVGTAIAGAGQYSAQAAARANGVSAAAQRAQGTFNQNSVNNANSIAADRIAQQYAFNSAQASMANDFTAQMWDKAASWNESMWQKMADYNSEEAEKNRRWQEQMRATAYQTAVKDMEAAGLNPVLAVTGGGIQTGAGSGSAASVGAPSMSGATGYAATGGLTNALAASEGNYTGQMEYMAGWLGLLGAGINGLSSAFKNFGSLGDLGAALGNSLTQFFNDGAKNPGQDLGEKIAEEFKDALPWTKNGKYDRQKHSGERGGSHGSFATPTIPENRR